MKPKKIKKVFKEFGNERIDNFFWMRNKKDPDVLKYIKYENSLTEEYLSDTKSFQEKVFKELKSRKRDQDVSVPFFCNGYWYIKKFEKGKEYPISFRKKGNMKAKAEKMLDQNQLAKGKKYFNIAVAAVSPDNRYLAYAEDVKADKRYVLKIKDLKTGKMLPDEITDTPGSFVWGNDSKTIFYLKMDEVTMRPCQVKRHILGNRGGDDLIFEEKNDIYYLGIAKTRSKKFILVEVGSHDHAFQYYFEADGDVHKPEIFIEPKNGVLYNIDHAEGYWYILTNIKAIDFEIFRTLETKKARKNWISFIKPRDGFRYENFALFKNHLAYLEIVAGVPNFKIRDLRTSKTHTIKFKETLYGGDFTVNPEFESNKLRISYETLKDPLTEYEYDMQANKLKVLKINKPKGRYDETKYKIERKWVVARDGARVPVSIFYKKDLKLNGSNPCLLYGYGSYGHSMPQTFNENIISLIDRGFVYVVAHIRGGQEMGRKWYLDGKFLKKKNTFNDFIDCAEFLINKKYTGKDKLVARGGSAGGLLMGAVANMRPDLFRAMVFIVPFVDVINTMMDASIPLTTGEYVEWGDPREKKYFEYMKSYAPYENIKKGAYPQIFIESGYNDTQVHYWEPLKYIAKMKDLNKDKRDIFLRMDLDTGHGGKTGRFIYLHDVARIYAFICKAVGVKK